MNTYLKYKSVWFKVFALGSLMFGCALISSLISSALAAKFSGFTFQEVLQPDFTNPRMMSLQKWLLPLNSAIASFLLPSLLYAYFADPHPRRFLRTDIKPAPYYWIIAVIIIVVAIPSAFWAGELNKHLDLSHVYPSFDKWMKESETLTNDIIEKMIGKQRVGDMIINLFLFALLPAISEEFFFRGLVLKGLIRSTRNVWLGIILSAFIFSAAHLQFLTFLTRFEMGIILGALFWYSGSLWVSIIAHFAFNGLQIVLSYYMPDLPDTSPTIIPPQIAGISFLLVIFLIFIMKRKSTVTMSEVYDDDDDGGFVIESKDQFL